MPSVVKDRVWPSIGYEPHDGQALIHNSLTRFRLASCGRRFGKSVVGARELVPEAALTYTMRNHLDDIGKQRIFWIVGPDYSDDEKEWRVFYDDMKRLKFPFDKPGTYNNPHTGDMVMSLFDGKFQVLAKSAMYLDSLDGEGLSGALLVEAAKLKLTVWNKYIRPALADYRGWALMTSTPEGKNWYYDKYQDGQNPAEPEWESWRMPSWMNPIIFPDGRNDAEIRSMERSMSPQAFQQEVAADFTQFVGRVFSTFEEEVHVRDLEYNPDLPVYLAADYGWTNPTVVLVIQVDAFDRVYVLDEYRANHRDINDIAQDLLHRPLTRQASVLYPDPAGPNETAVLEKALHVTANTSTGGELQWRLELIRQHLKYEPESEGHPPAVREPRLYIDRTCYGLIQEMMDYRYPQTREESMRAEPEKPLDVDDHGPEALGRFFRGYYGGPNENKAPSRARIRKAVMSSGNRR